MLNLEISFVLARTIERELIQQFDHLDRLAFADTDNDDNSADLSIDWNSTCDWFAFGWLGSEPVTQLCLVKREIEVAQTQVWVAGIGGVATHPNWQRHGFATRLLLATETFMREELGVPFGLLICANRTRPFYESVGWKHVADELFFAQKDLTKRSMKTNVMISMLTNEIWPLGVIDLCGAPW